MATKAQHFATDLANIFDDDFGSTATVSAVVYDCIIEDVIKAEGDEAGGPLPTYDTKVHFKAANLSSITIGVTFTTTGPALTLLPISQSISPDGNHLIVNCMRA